ncbi:MAG: hypothetical protein ACK4N5_18220, partial [Myxococcales bacterium]
MAKLSRMPARELLLAAVAAFALCTAVAGCSCDEPPKTQRIAEEYSVVEGNPAVDTGKPKVDREEPTSPSFKLNVPRQCDFFQQNAVRKVDILWVVDNSFSMRTSQANLANEFPKFIEQLVKVDPNNPRPPVDFHIGVTSTDVDNEQLVYDTGRDSPIPASRIGTRGRLHGFDLGGGLAARYIACDATGACNVPANRAGEAFAQMSKVGTAGSPSEKGLLATYQALTLTENIRAENPQSPDQSRREPFIRDDAALFIVFVSDEDDSSCGPFVPLKGDGRPVSGEPCTADPGCRCDVSRLQWGSVQYFVRFLESYKGYGGKDLVAAGAVVCTQKQQVPSQPGDPNFMHLGCPDTGSGSTAYFGDRYIQVAAATGGTAISIRGSFANALQTLGFAVSGLRRDFRLSRGPITETIEVYVSRDGAPRCTADAQCTGGERCRNGTCARPVTVDSRSLSGCSTDGQNKPGVEYCKCDASSFRNILRF